MFHLRAALAGGMGARFGDESLAGLVWLVARRDGRPLWLHDVVRVLQGTTVHAIAAAVRTFAEQLGVTMPPLDGHVAIERAMREADLVDSHLADGGNVLHLAYKLMDVAEDAGLRTGRALGPLAGASIALAAAGCGQALPRTVLVQIVTSLGCGPDTTAARKRKTELERVLYATAVSELAWYGDGRKRLTPADIELAALLHLKRGGGGKLDPPAFARAERKRKAAPPEDEQPAAEDDRAPGDDVPIGEADIPEADMARYLHSDDERAKRARIVETLEKQTEQPAGSAP